MRSTLIFVMALVLIDWSAGAVRANRAGPPVIFDPDRPITSPVSLAVIGVCLSGTCLWAGFWLKARMQRKEHGDATFQRIVTLQRAEKALTRSMTVVFGLFLLFLILVVAITAIQHARNVSEMDKAGRQNQAGSGKAMELN